MFGSPVATVATGTSRTWRRWRRPWSTSRGRPACPRFLTRGWLDTRYVGGLGQAKLGDGKSIAAAVVAKPTDWTFRKGHRIALVVQTSSLEWVAPKPYDGGAPSPTYAL